MTNKTGNNKKAPFTIQQGDSTACACDRLVNEATRKRKLSSKYLEDVGPVLVEDQTMTSHQQHDLLCPLQQDDGPGNVH